jgi:Flp pilus assembly protein TadG
MSCRVYLRARARGTRRSGRECGAAALEFALVAPLLFALLFGIISFGYMLSFRQGISQGAAEGARAAAVEFNSANQSTVALAALNRSLESYGVSCSGTSLTKDGDTVGTCSVTIANCSNDATKTCASVHVTYAYRDHPLLPSFPGLGATLPEDLDYTAVAEVS